MLDVARAWGHKRGENCVQQNRKYKKKVMVIKWSHYVQIILHLSYFCKKDFVDARARCPEWKPTTVAMVGSLTDSLHRRASSVAREVHVRRGCCCYSSTATRTKKRNKNWGLLIGRRWRWWCLCKYRRGSENKNREWESKTIKEIYKVK